MFGWRWREAQKTVDVSVPCEWRSAAYIGDGVELSLVNSLTQVIEAQILHVKNSPRWSAFRRGAMLDDFATEAAAKRRCEEVTHAVVAMEK